jgi:hypothetical protein
MNRQWMHVRARSILTRRITYSCRPCQYFRFVLRYGSAARCLLTMVSHVPESFAIPPFGGYSGIRLSRVTAEGRVTREARIEGH